MIASPRLLPADRWCDRCGVGWRTPPETCWYCRGDDAVTEHFGVKWDDVRADEAYWGRR